MGAPPLGNSGLLLDFSQSVRTVAAGLAGRDVTAWEIADELLAVHPEYSGSQLPRSSPSRGRREPLERWLMLVASLFDRDAVRASPARVIDSRMTLLSLARLEPELGLLYRRWGIAAKLADDVAMSRETVFRGWALPRRPSEWCEFAVFGGPEDLAGPCALSPDGTLLAIASVEGDEFATRRPGTAHLWDVVSGSERAVLRGHRADLCSCTFSPDGTLLVTTSDDTTARIWKVASGSERAVLRGHEGAGWRGAIGSSAFSPQGSVVATAGDDGTARLWDATSGSEKSALRGHRDFLSRCTFNRDGSLLATASFDGTARLWDVAAGSERAVLRGHEGPVWWCAFSPDGSLLATASRDGTARLWDVTSGGERSVLPCDDDYDVEWCTFSPDGTVLATRSSWAPELWDVASGSRRSVLRGPDSLSWRVRSALTAACSRGQAPTAPCGSGTSRPASNARCSCTETTFGMTFHGAHSARREASSSRRLAPVSLRGTQCGSGSRSSPGARPRTRKRAPTCSATTSLFRCG